MIAKICENCKYFRQHYVRWGKEGRRFKYVTAGCGHCLCSQLKHRKPERKACESFEEI